jgi:Flp pilus assembly protein TadG
MSPFTRRQTGATLVEFVIISPIALLVVMALIQLGLLFSAKQLLNEATFIAARAGSVENAQTEAMTDALVKAMIPFYQDTTITDSTTRVQTAFTLASSDLAVPGNLNLTVLNPTAAVFDDFGLPDASNHTYIPNDSLQYRSYTVHGKSTGLSIQDANVLKIRVTYAYQLKVPLMVYVFRSLCLIADDTGVNAFGRGGGLVSSDCAQYYENGRAPLVAYATVQMQTPAWQQN